jgi:hypothetical protein
MVIEVTAELLVVVGADRAFCFLFQLLSHVSRHYCYRIINRDSASEQAFRVWDLLDFVITFHIVQVKRWRYAEMLLGVA